jgi:hypothetical protein
MLESADDREDILLAHEQHFLVAFELEFFAGVRGEQHLLAHFHLQLSALSVFRDPTVANRDYFPFLRLILRRIRLNDSASRRLLRFLSLHHHTITQRFEPHRRALLDFPQPT